MPQLRYLIGDATDPVQKPAIIAHCCNSVNKWGSGFVLALSAKFPEPEKEYHNWFATGKPQLGDVQFVTVAPDLIVANIIGQEGTRWKGNVPPIRYDALAKGLDLTYKKALNGGLSVHAPMLGMGRAGGSPKVIDKLIRGSMLVDTYIYTLENEKDKWEGTPYEAST